MNDNLSIFDNVDDLYGKKIKSVPKPNIEIGIDTNGVLSDEIIAAELEKKLNTNDINSFSQQSQNRNQLYDLIDTMCEDSTISAIVETYAEDSTEYNDKGKIVWADSSDSKISKYINFLIDSMNIDKNIYKWALSLCKYGDLYLRLYRKSEYKDPIFTKDEDKTLNENLYINEYSKNDKFVHYIEMVQNPAEIFELTKFGKTYGYIKADVTSVNMNTMSDSYYTANLTYKFKQHDIEIFDAKTFVHACLEDNTTRYKEEVNIYTDNLDTDIKNGNSYNYSVRRGQSLLYNTFKTWRQLKLLEDSILLNRVTKSSVTRIIGVEIGDMPKEQVGPHLQGIKQLIEQKAALNVNQSISEYTNPGPMDNCIYVPTRDGKGAITPQTLGGGDVDVKSLADLDYFKNKLFGSLKAPKQYFGDTDDGAGFNGGTSLSIISSRYAKTVKKIQNTLIQAITDVINLLLIDKNLSSYINKFTIKMQSPTTQEELDRRDNASNKIDMISNIMNLFDMIEDPIIRLKMIKSQLAEVISDSELLELIQEQIDLFEKGKKDEQIDIDSESSDDYKEDEDTFLDSSPMNLEPSKDTYNNTDLNSQPDEYISKLSDTYLPTPNELGVDMTDSNSDL